MTPTSPYTPPWSSDPCHLGIPLIIVLSTSLCQPTKTGWLAQWDRAPTSGEKFRLAIALRRGRDSLDRHYRVRSWVPPRFFGLLTQQADEAQGAHLEGMASSLPQDRRIGLGKSFCFLFLFFWLVEIFSPFLWTTQNQRNLDEFYQPFVHPCFWTMLMLQRPLYSLCRREGLVDTIDPVNRVFVGLVKSYHHNYNGLVWDKAHVDISVRV